MNSLNLSVDELIFCFYSEGYFEQGIALKETYYPDLDDTELQFLLEVATRSLLAKDLLVEEAHRYKLKKDYKNFIHVLNNAERSIKASKFTQNLSEEESITIHYLNNEAYLHFLQYDHQVHSISAIKTEQVMGKISEFFNSPSLETNEKIIFQISDDEFENLLEEASTGSSSNIPVTFQQNDEFEEFQHDVKNRKGKMDSLLNMKYSNQNLPEFLDICFIIPGRINSWMINKNMENGGYIIQKANEPSIERLILNNYSSIS